MLDLGKTLFKNVISLKPSHYLSEMRIVIPKDEMVSENLSIPPKGSQVVTEEDETGFEKKKKEPIPHPTPQKKLEIFTNHLTF